MSERKNKIEALKSKVKQANASDLSFKAKVIILEILELLDETKD